MAREGQESVECQLSKNRKKGGISREETREKGREQGRLRKEE